MSVKLEHPDLAQHQATTMLQMREFWKEGHLCDIVVKSRDATEHRAHIAVLSAASIVLKTLLGGSFLEADQVQHGQPVEICASDASVFALLDYIYCGQPEVPVEDSIELLRLADAYNLPKLAVAIDAGLRASLENAPVPTALKILLESQGLHCLKAACEDQVALNFEACTQHPDFLELSATQLGRIVQRDDLNVQREDVVLQGIFRWLNHSKDRDPFLGLLLQHVDFPSISFENLGRIGRFAASIGPNGDELQREVDKALQLHRKQSSEATASSRVPKRRSLQHWSPELGASSEGARQVMSRPCFSLCWHEGAVYAADATGNPCSVLCWKPHSGCEPRVVAGEGAGVMAGINDLGLLCAVFVSLSGDIVVADLENMRLVSFRNGFGQLMLSDLEDFRYISPNGVVYAASEDGYRLKKLVGRTFQPITDQLPFKVNSIFVTKEEVVYFSDSSRGLILRVDPGEADREAVVVGEVTGGANSEPMGLSVTEDGKIYVADPGQRKVWAFHPGDTTCFEVLQCPEGLQAWAVLAQDRSLYVSMGKDDGECIKGGVYEYLFPPELKLEYE